MSTVSKSKLWVGIALVIVIGAFAALYALKAGPFTTNLDTHTWPQYTHNGYRLSTKFHPTWSIIDGHSADFLNFEATQNDESLSINVAPVDESTFEEFAGKQLGLESGSIQIISEPYTHTRHQNDTETTIVAEEAPYRYILRFENVPDELIEPLFGTLQLGEAVYALPENSQFQAQKHEFVQFSGVEFKNFFDQLTLPETTPPKEYGITGNEAADTHIRSRAEARGYKNRPVAQAQLVTLEGKPINDAVVEPWKSLKEAAATEGISLAITSGYRPPELQRSIFMSRFSQEAVARIGRQYTAEEIVNGEADAAIEAVLQFSSIPGYSKHHTGYTLDIRQAGSPHSEFKNTAGFTWISKNNYENAKRFGFLPSYPENAGTQGPDPEAWEYVWVGSELLRYGE